MSLKNIKILSINSCFIALLIQNFLSGYKTSCSLKKIFMAIPIIFSESSRKKLVKAKNTSKISSLFLKEKNIYEIKLSGNSFSSGYLERYNYLMPYCKKALIILINEEKIKIDNNGEIFINYTDSYKNYEKEMKEITRAAFYLGVIFSETSNEELSYFLGVDL